MIRVTEEGGRLRVRLQDLRVRAPIEFETWIAAWAYLDAVLHEKPQPANGNVGSRRQE